MNTIVFVVVHSLLALISPVPDPVAWSFKAIPAGEGYRLQLIAQLHPGWHLYSQVQPENAIALPTRINFIANPLTTHLGKVVEVGKLQKVKDETLGTEANYFSHSVVFSQEVRVKKKIKTNVGGSITYQVCTDEKCLPPKTITFSMALE